MADQVNDIEVEDRGLYRAERSASVPEPRVFLASNVNNNKVANICNRILWVILFLIILVGVLLLILVIMAWSSRETNQVTTTRAPQREF